LPIDQQSREGLNAVPDPADHSSSYQGDVGARNLALIQGMHSPLVAQRDILVEQFCISLCCAAAQLRPGRRDRTGTRWQIENEMHFWRSNLQQSPGRPETKSFLSATCHGLSKARFYVLTFFLFAAVVPASAQQHDPTYIYDGGTLHVPDDAHTYAKYGRWQVWLYHTGVRIPHHAVGLQYSRWGLIEGGSPESVTKKLRDAQRFEEVYLSFFGPGTWGRYTFSNPLGPIAIADHVTENDTTALGYQLDGLRGWVNTLIVNAQPSLENNESEGPSSPHKEYFDQIREALQQISRISSQLARAPNDVHYISEEIARLGKVVRQTEKDLPKIAASLPTVRLPTSNTWMFHTEGAGTDGTIQVEVAESALGVSVQQTWTGGDGTMAGTVIVTTIAFDNIGKVEFRPRMEKGDETSTVFVQSGRDFFPETINSPVRHSPKRMLPAVNLTTTSSSLYFTFRDRADAQNAYAYFLYHQEVGR